MIEYFGQRNRLRVALPCLLRSACELQRVAALGMAANAGIMTAERMAEVTVAVYVVEFDAMPAIFQCGCDIAAKERRRPAAMIGLEQQLFIAGVLRERHQFAGPVACQCGLAPEIGVEPQAPFGLEQSGTIVQPLADFVGAGI